MQAIVTFLNLNTVLKKDILHSICVCLSNFPEKPIITTQPMSQFSQVANNVTFTCAANANHQALIQWIFNGNVLRNMSGTKYLITNETEGNCVINDPLGQCETSSTLEIFNTQPADSGEYTCKATNAAGASIESAELTIAGNTKFHMFALHIIEYLRRIHFMYACILNKLYCIMFLLYHQLQ